MTNEEIEKRIMDKCHLTDEQIAERTDTIIQAMASDKVPSEHPICVVVGGQSGAGKTALINYTLQMSPEREFVVIDNDFFRGFHPMAKEIKANFPEFYTAATDQLGLGITSDVISYFMQNNYDVILHQTLKNNRIADDAMTKFKDAGYTVGARAFAVPYLESKMSQIERCEAQFNKMGFCRHVRPVDHNAAIEGLPKTVGYIEENGKYDFIEIFKRGESISQPDLVYSKINPETKEETLKALENCENVCHEDFSNGFTNAQEAVEKTRDQEAVKCAEGLQDRIDEVVKNGGYEIPGMKEHLDEITSALSAFNEHSKIIEYIKNGNQETPSETSNETTSNPSDFNAQ